MTFNDEKFQMIVSTQSISVEEVMAKRICEWCGEEEWKALNKAGRDRYVRFATELVILMRMMKAE